MRKTESGAYDEEIRLSTIGELPDLRVPGPVCCRQMLIKCLQHP
jgi:hypothetical protein